MTVTRSLVWFRRAARFGAVLAAIVVVVGAWVRLTNAGLGCPDWPGCYGHVHPAAVVEQVDLARADYAARPFDYQKALHEMVHRYIASSLGLVIVGLAIYAWRHRRDRGVPRRLPFVLVAIVLMQGALGAFTVTLLLKPVIVTSHLIGGLTTMGILWWLSLSREERRPVPTERGLRRLALAAVTVLGAQILLGGWTSTNYAAVACPDFPTCQGTFRPQTDFADGFRVTRPTGVDYEGGVLSQPARTAIHYTHRVGAVVVGLLLTVTALWALFGHALPTSVRVAGACVLSAVILQWLIGMNLIWQGFPLWLGTSHNAGAALLILASLLLVRRLTPTHAAIGLAAEAR